MTEVMGGASQCSFSTIIFLVHIICFGFFLNTRSVAVVIMYVSKSTQSVFPV